MFRRVFTLLSAVSLLLCLATIVLWVWTRTGRDLSIGRWPEGKVAAAANRHSLMVHWRTERGSRPPDPLPRGFHDFYEMETLYEGHGMLVMRFQDTIAKFEPGGLFGPQPPPVYVATDTNVAISYWLVAAVTAVLPAMFVAGAFLRRWRRRRAGCCLACGYDLRASPDRCPECGKIAAPSR
jgi:hypothetical protein